jgi:hypothetical protein
MNILLVYSCNVCPVPNSTQNIKFKTKCFTRPITCQNILCVRDFVLLKIVLFLFY